MIPIRSYNPPGLYGFSSYTSVPQRTVPVGPHEWERTEAGRKCRKCEMGIVIGTDGLEQVLRLAGTLCSDVLAMEIMES